MEIWGGRQDTNRQVRVGGVAPLYREAPLHRSRNRHVALTGVLLDHYGASRGNPIYSNDPLVLTCSREMPEPVTRRREFLLPMVLALPLIIRIRPPGVPALQSWCSPFDSRATCGILATSLGPGGQRWRGPGTT